MLREAECRQQYDRCLRGEVPWTQAATRSNQTGTIFVFRDVKRIYVNLYIVSDENLLWNSERENREVLMQVIRTVGNFAGSSNKNIWGERDTADVRHLRHGSAEEKATAEGRLIHPLFPHD